MKKTLLLAIPLFIFSCNSSKEKTEAKPLVQSDTEIKQATPLTSKSESLKIDSLTSQVDAVTTEKKKIYIKEVEAPSTTVISEKKKEINTVKKSLSEGKKTILKQEKIATKETPQAEELLVSSKPNHNLWDALASTFVSANGNVNYKSLKKNILKVTDYLSELENKPPQKDWSKNEKLAYWFNLYNAATVYLIASNYPVKSIKDINNGKPWDKKFIKSGANLYSLNEIENTIVRPNYNEPRLHVAFNCAAVSCPNLFNQAFTAGKLNNQLNTLSTKWLNDTSKNKISEKEIQISQIFNWYAADFKKGVIPFINKYSAIKASNNAKITYLDYNWNLNE